MIRQLAALVASGNAELAVKRRGIDADAHRRHLHRAAENIVPEHYIAVEIPVIVVGCASVVLLTGAERAADTDDERGLMLPEIGIFPLLRRKLRVCVLKLLACHERDTAIQLAEALKLRIYGLHGVLRVAYGLHYVHNG